MLIRADCDPEAAGPSNDIEVLTRKPAQSMRPGAVFGIKSKSKLPLFSAHGFCALNRITDALKVYRVFAPPFQGSRRA